jgi:prepilin-type N-terminal cleavage/methylation domain-containing protein
MKKTINTLPAFKNQTSIAGSRLCSGVSKPVIRPAWVPEQSRGTSRLGAAEPAICVISNPNRQGFTIAELLVSTAILALLITFASTVYVNFYGSVQNLKAMNLVYEEARFTMDRITKEIRNGTIDYEEYYNQTLFCSNWGDNCEIARNTTYGQNYCQYSLQFYNPGPDGEIGTVDDENTGRLAEDSPSAIPNPIQNNLFLININGDERSYIKRIEETDPATGKTTGRIGLLKLKGGDFGIDHIDASAYPACAPDPGENDGRIDTWSCEEGFNCTKVDLAGSDSCAGTGDEIIFNPAIPAETSYVDITPAALDIVDLKFIISPANDPRKAFNDDTVQIQPSITIKLTVRANPKIASEFERDRVPSIILESTISARAQNAIITECNLKQCFPGAEKPCPLSTGVCISSEGNPAMQTCTEDYLWPGCQPDTYRAFAEQEWGAAYAAYYAGLSKSLPGDGKVYQAGSEFASCPQDNISCKTDFCTDSFDNDANGSKDGADPNCKFYLCNNGTYDGEDVEAEPNCPDVGGICQQIRPLEEGREINCYDGYDNDCDGYADEFDVDCIRQLCTNGEHDPEENIETYQFLGRDYDQPNYLLNAKPADYVTAFDESCDKDNPGVDIGGICDLCKTDDTKDESEKGSCVCGVGGCTNEKIVTGAESQTKETICNDNLDNDCDGNADEFDEDCLAIICADDKQNCDLAPPDYETKNYLVNYNDTKCDYPFNKNDEACKDVGGLCDNLSIPTPERYYDHKLINNEASPVAPTTSAMSCADGLDNDCDGLIDWQDEDCCPDIDGDLAIGKSANCFIEKEDAEGAGMKFDCAEGDSSRFPGATEICDGKADEDCDGLPDNIDPDCCVDTDGDGYGVADAYISCKYNDKPDCDDKNKNINPGILETGDLCMNEDMYGPMNDDCNISDPFEDPENPSEKITSERANHIDWYRNEPGGIARAYAYKLFEPTCCTGVFEICNDNTYGTSGSDENCNGLEGLDDKYCFYLDNDKKKVGLYDNFGASQFFYLPGAPETDDLIVYNAAESLITLTTSADTAIVSSQTLSSILDIGSCESYSASISSADAETPGSTSVRFQLSEDAGTTWCGNDNCAGDWIDLSELGSLVNFTNPLLRWRAELSGDTVNMPELKSITIDTKCTS